MTSSKYPSSNQANPKGWKIAQSLHTLIRQFNPSDWFMLMVIGGLLIITAHSLYLSGWQIDLPVIASISAISILVSYALACSRYDELFALISTCLYGILSTLLVVSFSQSRQLQAGLNATLTHVALWIVNIFNGQFEPDPVILTLLASILFWFFNFRQHQSGRVIWLLVIVNNHKWHSSSVGFLFASDLFGKGYISVALALDAQRSHPLGPVYSANVISMIKLKQKRGPTSILIWWRTAGNGEEDRCLFAPTLKLWLNLKRLSISRELRITIITSHQGMKTVTKVSSILKIRLAS